MNDPRWDALTTLQNAIGAHGANPQPYRALGNIMAKAKGDLILFNYTPSAAYDRTWTPMEQICRGLILRLSTQEVVALPFFKFFNVNEREETQLAHLAHLPDGVTRKVDGALGITYLAADGLPAIATRGSFDSAEAQWATAYLRENHADFCARYQGDSTLLMEICAPLEIQPHITPEREGLVLIGQRSLHPDTFGDDALYTHLVRTAADYGFPVVETYFYSTAEIVERCGNETHEGYVARYGDLRVKFKTAHYIAINRIIQSLSPRRLRDYLQEGGDIDEVLRALPAWYATLLRAAATSMREAIEDQSNYALARYEALRAIEGGREFAEAAQQEVPAIRAALFALRKDKLHLPILWKWLDLTLYELGFGAAGLGADGG